MNFTFKDNISEKDFNDFTYKHEHGTFFQMSGWAKVKAEWIPIYTGVYAGDKLVGVCLVLKRKLFLNLSILYAPRGPVLDFEDKDLLDYYLKQLKTVAKRHSAISLTIDPFVQRASYLMSDAMFGELDVVNDDSIIEIFENDGFKHKGFVLNLRDSFQPRFTPYINLNTDRYKESKGYKTGLKALDKGVKIERGGLELVERLHAMISLTEEHKNINLRGTEYFKRLVNEFKEDCLITIAYMDFELELQNCNDRLIDIEERLDNPTLKKGRRNEYNNQRNSILKDIDFFEKQLETRNKADIAALIGLKNGTKSELLYAGMDRDFQKYSGSYINYVDAIEWSKEHNLELVSFGGNSGKFNHGIDKFKVLYEPTVLEYVGEFTYINKKFTHALFEKAVEIRRNLNKKKD